MFCLKGPCFIEDIESLLKREGAFSMFFGGY